MDRYKDGEEDWGHDRELVSSAPFWEDLLPSEDEKDLLQYLPNTPPSRGHHVPDPSTFMVAISDMRYVRLFMDTVVAAELEI